MTSTHGSRPRPGFVTVFREDARRILPLTGAASVAVVIAAILSLLLGLALPFAKYVLIALVVVGTAALVWGTPLVLGAFFYITMAGREAPIALSWPLKGRTLFFGKLAAGLVGIAMAALAALIVFGLVLIMLSDPVGFGLYEQMWNVLSRSGEKVVWITTVSVLWGALGFVGMLVLTYFAVLVGSRGWFAKLGIGGPLLAGFATWAVAFQLLPFLSMLIPISFNMNTFQVEFMGIVTIVMEAGNSTAQGFVPLGIPVVQFLATVGMLWYCVHASSRVRDIS